MAGLEKQIKKLAPDSGAAAVGISSIDRLGPEPSMDPRYLLPGARSLISMMIPLDGDLIRRPEKRHRVTCGNCQLVCWKTRQERMGNYDILVESGEIKEGPGFSFVRAGQVVQD